MRHPSLLFLLATLSCGHPGRSLETDDDVAAPVAPVAVVASFDLAAEPAPAASERVDTPPDAQGFHDDIASVFGAHPGHQMGLQTDKPLYKPGETVWFRGFDRELGGPDATHPPFPVMARLLDPGGGTFAEGRLKNTDGEGVGQFDLPAGMNGGRYVLQLSEGDEVLASRPVIVDVYEAPRMLKKVDFLRQAYGGGDTAAANVTLKRPTGEPLANTTFEVIATVDGTELPRTTATTDARGIALLRVELPATIAVGEGLLTLRIDDGGLIESISRPLPLVAKRVELAFFPEGGDLIEGLESRVYFRGRKLTGKPADLTGRIRDDQGNEVATFASVREGLGRFTFTPQPGRTYHAVIASPSTIEGTYPLPAAREEGCVLRAYDDFAGTDEVVKAAVRCTGEQTVTVLGVRGEHILDTASVKAGIQPGVVHLPDPGPIGPVRLTALGEDGQPVAERLVFRHPDRAVNIQVTPKSERLSPRDEVVLDIETTDADGEPVSASLAMAVVDETVLSLADDKEPHLLSTLLLTSITDDVIFEPNRYFDPETENRLVALDLVVGTYGWRRFQWVREPTPEMVARMNRRNSARQQARWADGPGADKGFGGLEEGLEFARDVPVAAGAPPRGPRGGRPMPKPKPIPRPAPAAPPPPMAAAPAVAAPPAEAPLLMIQKREAPAADRARRRADAEADEEMIALGDLQIMAPPVQDWMLVRAFPVPTHDPGYDGPRSDFRDTIYWNPQVQTDDEGHATVRFPASDAVASFRVDTQGLAGGNVGRDESRFNVKLPFSMALKLPRAVTEGDVVEVPLALTNELDRPLELTIEGTFGDGLETAWTGARPALGAGARSAETIALTVTGKDQPVTLGFTANGSGQSDAFERTLDIQAKGFPQYAEAAEELEGTRRFDIDLGEAIAGTVQASVTLYPGPAGSLMEGLEGMLREPGGCFEQTSSSNYPNIMVMQYLQENELAEPEIADRAAGMLDRGYARLVGYETAEKGYEWFGGTPAHEALTAYGLVEFMDMAVVHDGVDRAMIDRTSAYLLDRRDGEGGYQRSAQALDSFGRAAPEVTDAYITWSLAAAGSTDALGKELARARSTASTTEDAYVLALSALALLEAGDAAGPQAVVRLESMQADSGGFDNADHSITRSGGKSLHVETTALAALAMLQAGRKGQPLRAAIGFLHGSRSGHGSFGSTQATVLALKALTTYANATRATASAGELIVHVNGQEIGSVAYEAGHQGAVEIGDFGSRMLPGANTITVTHDGAALPMSLIVDYRSTKPATSAETAVHLDTSLARDVVPVGETVGLDATVTNKTNEGLPMTLARLGIPGGLAPQTWQLEDLRKEGKIAYFETTPKEVILYWRDMAPESSRAVHLDLMAEVAGTYTGAASSTYLYYTDEHKHWVDGQQVRITR